MKREFYNCYCERFGREFTDKMIESFKLPYPQYLRVNTLKISCSELVKRLNAKGVFLEKQELDYCFKVVGKPFALSSTEEYLLGYFFLQDKSSMLSVSELGLKKDDVVLDCCGAPGGKATLMSQLMDNEGAIISVDNKAKRLKAEVFNIQRLGCKNIACYDLDALKLKRLDLKFDKILLDAPCSSTGTMWKEKKRIKSVNKHKVMESAKLQKGLIKSCFDALKKGGLMVYSTCSLESEENEDNALYAESLGLKKLKEKRFFPHIDDTIGFYYAVFKKL
jgi:NOL1/NOP2/sun family putative RNA methylase